LTQKFEVKILKFVRECNAALVRAVHVRLRRERERGSGLGYVQEIAVLYFEYILHAIHLPLDHLNSQSRGLFTRENRFLRLLSADSLHGLLYVVPVV